MNQGFITPYQRVRVWKLHE